MSGGKGKERKQKLRLIKRLPTSETDKQSLLWIHIAHHFFPSCIICASLENQLKPCCNLLRAALTHYPIDAPVKTKAYAPRVLLK